MESRADGRNQTIHDDLQAWRNEFSDVAEKMPQSLGAERLYLLERLAWIILQVGSLWVIAKRIGFPKREEDCLGLLQKEGLLSVEAARKLKYLVEARRLSSRLQSEIDEMLFTHDMKAELNEASEFISLCESHFH